MPVRMRSLVALSAFALATAVATTANAQKKYDPRASDTEIKIGNIMSLKDFTSEVLLPGIKVNTGANDFFPIEQMQLMKFNGEAWEVFGDVITGEVGH